MENDCENTSTVGYTSIRICVWNIQGGAAVKLRREEVDSVIASHDMVFLGETWLVDGEEDVCYTPMGFEMKGVSRPKQSIFRAGAGGVALVYRTDLPVQFIEEWCRADTLVFELGTSIFIGAYVCPRRSKWRRWTDVDPEDNITDILSLVTLQYAGRNIVLFGDMNARIGSNDTRRNQDTTRDGRGWWLQNIARDHDLTILNGSAADQAIAATFTSFQPTGRAVVDYILVQRAVASQLAKGTFRVSTKTVWSDHAYLSLDLPCRTNVIRLPHVPKQIPTVADDEREIRRSRPAWFRETPQLEMAATATIRAALHGEEAMKWLYGTPSTDGGEVEYTMEVLTKVHSANGEEAYLAITQGGKRTKEETFMGKVLHGEGGELGVLLYGLMWCIRQTSRYRRVVVRVRTPRLAQVLGKAMVEQEHLGYPASYGMEAREVVSAVQDRAAPVQIIIANDAHHPKLDGLLARMREASKDGTIADFPLPSNMHGTPPSNGLNSGLPESKIILPTIPVSAKPLHSTAGWLDSSIGGLRTSKAVREVLNENLEKLMNAKNDAEFWRILRAFTKAKPRPEKVRNEDLTDDFHGRLNPSEDAPAYFNDDLRERFRVLCDAIPTSSTDESLGQQFKIRVSEGDIILAKRRIRYRSKSATGADKVAYKTIMCIPNDVLAELFNMCITTGAAPNDWLTTVLIGLLKKGKEPEDPANYRLIGLESCMLKFFTLIIENRIRQWADEADFIPQTQNGFKPRMRTHNNPFILHTAIDRAHAGGKPLYVAFVDLKNAFPSTDINTLWLKMNKAGIAGPIFDWLRMVYARMVYVVRHNGSVSEAFKSLVGVLTGDSASPILWTIFFADLGEYIGSDEGDVALDGFAFSHVEHADDVAIWCTTLKGLQRKIDAFFRWCQDNFMIVSVTKTEWMIFGTTRIRGPLVIDGNELRLVSQYKFVGITFSSRKANMFHPHHIAKTAAARAAINTVFALEKQTGPLPATYLRRLYMAQIDPHLTFGCEVAILHTQADTKLYVDVQKTFIRRMLGVSKWCATVALYTETGIMPIQYRRMVVVLGSVKNTITLPLHALPTKADADAFDLLHRGYPGWAQVLDAALRRLQIPVALEWTAGARRDANWYSNAIDLVHRSCDAWLMDGVMTNVKLWMIRARIGRPGRNPKNTKRSLAHASFQNYLNMGSPDARRTITRLVFSEHHFAVEVLRRHDGQHRSAVPRSWRLCRFCRKDVEDEVHAILECEANHALVEARDEFWTAAEHRTKNIHGLVLKCERDARIGRILHMDSLAGLFANFVISVNNIYEDTPIWIASQEDMEGSREDTDEQRREEMVEEGSDLEENDEDYYLNVAFG